MLPKVRFVTILSGLHTSNSQALASSAGIETPIQFVKGVGPRLGSLFKNRNIETVKDLLQFFPRSYEDRSQILTVSELEDGTKATVTVKVLSQRQIPIRKLGRSILEVKCSDESGILTLKWFYPPKGMGARFVAGIQIIVTGKVKFFMGKPEIVHPEITWGVSADSGVESNHNFGRVVPIYTEIEGIPSRTFRKILWEALDKFSGFLNEDLPSAYLKKYQFPTLQEAVRSIHFPPEDEKVDLEKLSAASTPAHWRLIYEELFKFEYTVLRHRLRMERSQAPSFGHLDGKAAVLDLEKSLPFRLTRHQTQAIQDILNDLSQSYPMNRLIQGDVGSGKTAVALLTAGAVIAEGGQVALMAPTEILAEQHFKSVTKFFGSRMKTYLLTGKTPASERKRILSRVSSGEPSLLIGTHALLEDPVVFSHLVYVMIDEQHRFGVEQRKTLRSKGIRKDPKTGKMVFPHSLILTATPIPRTLALTAYGDLSVTSIRELPPGRSPVRTEVIREKNQRTHAYQRIRAELQAGHQAYFIFPLVHESEAEGFTELKSAVAEAERLAKEVFPEFKVGLLHGQQKPEEKADIMGRFQTGQIQILVSTTVVEVGVDVPNATVMAIEHSERFGLSQLHQLRGRVGRGSAQSFCFLFSHQHLGEVTAQRLEVLEETNDGFKIAEADLEIRGPGEFLGARQAGALPFRLANLVRDKEWLLKAREDAVQLLREDPDLNRPEHLPLRKYYERTGDLQF